MKGPGGAMRGFSLLELLVAFAIMAISLAMIYRAVGGSVRNVSSIEDRQKAAWVVESVLAQIDGVPERGLALEGQTQEFRWTVRTAPYATGSTEPTAPRLHEVLVTVAWDESGRQLQVEMSVLKPEKTVLAPRRADTT